MKQSNIVCQKYEKLPKVGYLKKYERKGKTKKKLKIFF